MPEALHVKAAFVTELGAPSKIEIGDLTLPPPGATEAVVRVDAVCVNPVDTLVRSGRFATPVPMPLVLGRDLVGEVISAPQFSDFTPGDRGFHARLRRVAGEFRNRVGRAGGTALSNFGRRGSP